MIKGKLFKSTLSKVVACTIALSAIMPVTAKATTLSSQNTKKTLTQTQTSVGNKRIVAYFTEWSVYAGHNQYYISNIPWDKVTHINYAFATIKDGKVAVFDDWAANGITFGQSWDSPYNGNFGQIKKFKEKYPNTRVLISVGGWSQSAGFHDAAATPKSRKKFAASAVDFIRTYGFDGVDIDWEYPTFKREPDKNDNPNDQGTPNADDSEKQTFTLLLQDLKTALTDAGKTDSKYYELSAAVGSGKDKIEKTEPDKYSKYLDFINVMTYDMRGAWDNKTGLQSPLYKNPNDTASPLIKDYYNVDASLQLFQNYGIPKDKLIVGSPYYSRGWTGVKNDGPIKELPGLYASATGGARGAWDGGVPAGCNPYYKVQEMEKDSSFKKYREPYSQSPYLYSESRGEMYTYEDEISLNAKISYVNQNNYGGIIFWELSGDAPMKGSTLTNIIYNGFKDNLRPPVFDAEPITPSISTTTVSPEGNYTITANIKQYSNANTVKIFEGSNVILEQSIDNLNATTISKTIFLKAPGSYKYTVQLLNKFGSSTSKEITVVVPPCTLPPTIGGIIYPSISVDNSVNSGNYNISIVLQENNKADTLILYENDKLISTDKVDGTSSQTIKKTFSSKADGFYNYRAELTNVSGGKAVGGTMQVEVTHLSTTEIATDKPALPNLSTNNWNGASTFTLTMNSYWGNNGTMVKLYENGKVIKQQRLEDKTPTAQIVNFDINNKEKGSYNYYVELSNSKGTSTSNILSITVN
ncbi:chitinase [Clostridium cavendishii DSM 21758]|uniref:chitinase n=1 Tax=Clostridium cavendishii DSM 21758 TaxID=1121302 RepID=A0A1M6HXY5_9CLOT|nr:glycosyl hydrolase family 18 protein [Clostridium cavendishii]SHJ26947.1 chitinase [Clostridium cavendishii DSM 21758]